MSKSNSYTFLHYLRSRAAMLNIIIPLTLYYGAEYCFGIGAALLASACWAVFLALQSKNRQTTLAVAVMILLSGLGHFLFTHYDSWLPVQREDVFISLTGGLTVAVVFLFYSLQGKPVIQTFAEQARPQLQTMNIYGSPAYIRVWQEISLIWVAIFLGKTVVVYLLYHYHSPLLNTFLALAGWPLTLMMIFISIRWPRYRWQATARQS